MSNDTWSRGTLWEPNIRPTRARWIALLFVCALAAILYMDRVCFSQAVKPLQEELGLSNDDLSNVMVAFTVAYGVFEIPVGRWGDRIGARRVLTRIAVSWSLFTALTGACFGLWQLILVRFLFGAGEAGAYPNTARVLARWFPDAERARAQAFVLMASQLGSIAAMPLAGYLIAWGGWRVMFAAFGSLGALWAVLFYIWFRDDPAAHPAVNALEREHIGPSRADTVSRHDPIPWRLVSRNSSIWALASIMICAAFFSYFFYSWFPTYLKDARGMSVIKTGWLTALPYVGTSVGMLLGGVLAGRAFRTAVNRDAAVRWIGGVSYFLAAACLWLAVRCERSEALVAFAGASCLFTAATQPLWWSCAIAISGRHVGALFGLMNMAGLIGAGVSQKFIGVFTDWRARSGYSVREQWDPVFFVYVGVLLACALCWTLYRTREVEEPSSSVEEVL